MFFGEIAIQIFCPLYKWVICIFIIEIKSSYKGLPWWLRRLSVCLQCGRPRFKPWVGKIPWRRKWQSTPVLLPGKSHGQRSLVGCNIWGRKESDTTERLHFNSSYIFWMLDPYQICNLQIFPPILFYFLYYVH